MGSNKQSKRIFYFDALRALAIITVIMFHIFLRVENNVAPLYSIHPPFIWWETDFLATVCRCGVTIFLMLSGALSLGRQWEIKPFLKKRIPRIALPFAFWVTVLTCIIVLLYAFFNMDAIINYFPNFEPMTILKFYYNAIMGDTMWFTPYWFFWMILGTYLFMPIINKWLLHADLKEAEYFLAFWLITCLFDYTFKMKFPISLSYFAGPMGFVVLGYYLRHTERRIFNNIYYAIAIFIVSAAALMGLSYMFSDTNSFFLFNRYAILFSFEVAAIFCIFKNFGQLNLNFKFLTCPDSTFRKFIFSVAKYSYGIYLIHQFVLNILILLLANRLNFTVYIVTLIVFTLLISLGILAVLNRIPYLNQVIGAK